MLGTPVGMHGGGTYSTGPTHVNGAIAAPPGGAVPPYRPATLASACLRKDSATSDGLRLRSVTT
jgi:hypothetical protein